MVQCAYCEIDDAPTNEHLWPTSLHARLEAANKTNNKSFWLRRLAKEIPKEPTIKDVCAKCNNGVLSILDSYICNLFDKSFMNLPEKGDLVDFEFDYHLLKRWLLKMAYNSARIHNSLDIQAIKDMLPYILGSDTKLGKHTDLYLQLTFPEVIPDRDFIQGQAPDIPFLFYPTENRVGLFGFRVHGVGEKVLRAIHLRSYSFYLAYFRPGSDRSEQDKFCKVFLGEMENCVKLSPSFNNLQLKCGGMGAWQSFHGARENQIVEIKKPPII